MGIAISVLLASLWWTKVQTGSWIFACFLIVGGVFHIHQFTQLLFVGSAKVDMVVRRASELDLAKASMDDAPANSARRHYYFLIPIGTVILGFGTSLLFSLLEETFWFNSRYDIPLVMLPTMTIGDAVFLPWLNYLAFLAIAAARSDGFRFGRKEVGYFILTMAISLTLNSIANYSWCHDQFTGATDQVYGRLTLLGWWHYGFSVLEMEVILMLVGVWYFVIAKGSRTVQQLFLRAWRVLMVFSVLPILDAVSKSIFGYKGLSVTEILSLEIMSLLPMIFAITCASRNAVCAEVQTAKSELKPRLIGMAKIITG